MATRGAVWPTLALLAGTVAACADRSGTARSGAESSPAILGQQACFDPRQVQDFAVLDRSSLVVFAPSRRNAYRLEISPPAPGLRLANGLTFDSSPGQICGRAGDALLLPGAGPTRRYLIVDVRRLEPGQLDSLLANYGKGKPGGGMEPATAIATDTEPVETGADE